MAKIFWLASYPKSGNTWMRALLSNYLQDGEKPADINELQGGPIASSRVWFDEWAGVEASALDDAAIERLRPGVYHCMAREAQETLFMKVHDAWGCNDRGEALFPPEVTAGVVYILRNPLDLAASCAHHWGVSLEKAVDNLCHPDFSLSRRYGGLGAQLRQRLGSWSAHVRSWLDESNLPVLPVRYEDLLRDPRENFSRVVRFCNLPWEAARLQKAVAFSEFGELQHQEKERGFRERSVYAPGPFFRRGQSGAWHEELPAELAKRLIDTHYPTMARFGYLDDQRLSG
jgi:aryl sulfotransferase